METRAGDHGVSGADIGTDDSANGDDGVVIPSISSTPLPVPSILAVPSISVNAQKLRARRLLNNFTQAELASIAGIALATEYRMESGFTKAGTLKVLHSLALALKCRVTDIADFEGFEEFDLDAPLDEDGLPPRKHRED